MSADPRLRATLLAALRGAGALLKAELGRARVRYKGKANIVTQVDHASERFILRRILRRFPGHDFIAEERPARVRGAEYAWVIDPLDGTTNYAHGFPAACVSIGLLRRGLPLLGGVFDPFRGELFWAERGRGARLNGRPMRVSRVRRVSESLLLTGFPYDRGARSRFYAEFYRTFMTRSHDVRRSGSAALDLAWVAAGRADGFWEFNLRPWDVAAGMLLVEEAGGRVGDFRGRPWPGPATFGRRTLATNGRIHAEMLRVLDLPRLWRGARAHTRD